MKPINIRCLKFIITFHDTFHITKFKLVIAIELLDNLAIFVPVIGSTGSEDGRLGIHI